MGSDHTKYMAPMAVAGMMAAFAGGALLGMLGGKKAAIMHEEGGMMHKRMWLAGHHHHGWGGPACRMTHEMAAPGAMHEEPGYRPEGE
jgi:hypothetical protein